MMRTRDLTGTQFGELTALRMDGHIGKSKKVAWLCMCSCGNATRSAVGDLLRNDKRKKRSCGCINHLTGERSPHWRGRGGISGTYWSRVKSQAKRRGITMDITIEEAAEIFKKQMGYCRLTGFPIQLNVSASFDRIDSSKGYTYNNVQWTHKDVNRLKSNFDEKELIKLCKAIVEYAEE